MDWPEEHDRREYKKPPVYVSDKCHECEEPLPINKGIKIAGNVYCNQTCFMRFMRRFM